MSDFSIGDLFREAKEHGWVVALLVTPDGGYFKTALSPELVDDEPEAAGQLLLTEFKHSMAVARKERDRASHPEPPEQER